MSQRSKLATAAFFAALALAVASTALSLAGCTGTRAAYKAAESPDEVAYVIYEQYAALLHEAAGLREKPTTPPEAVAAMQAADTAAQPAVDALPRLADAYKRADAAYKETQSAETQAALVAAQAALQAAIDDAAKAIAGVIGAVKQARGGEA